MTLSQPRPRARRSLAGGGRFFRLKGVCVASRMGRSVFLSSKTVLPQRFSDSSEQHALVSLSALTSLCRTRCDRIIGGNGKEFSLRSGQGQKRQCEINT